jgi:hypothetical protein
MGSTAPWIFIGGVLLVGTIVGFGTAWFLATTYDDRENNDGQPGPY